MTAISYTAEQQAALRTRDVPIAVDAGAGCGKTFVLTERFLSHLDPQWDDAPPAELDQLVAVTFTDAAAREMRDRIRSKCRARLAAAQGDSAAFWRRLLRSLDSARVSTIHGLASRLIRDHAIELGVDPAFTVLDPAESAVLKTAAVDESLRERLAPTEAGLDHELIDAAAQFDLAGLRAHVRALASHAHRPEFPTWLTRSADELVGSWLEYYRERVAPGYARDFLAAPEVARLRELMAQATPVKAGFADRLADLADALADLEESSDADRDLKRLQPLLRFRDPETNKDLCGVKDWPEKALKSDFTATLKSLRERLQKNRQAGDPGSMRRAAELGLCVHRLAANAAARYRQAKRDRGVLDNDDLLIEAHRLLTDPALAQASQRIAGRVQILLVDEFQDTDRLQAELVQAIAGDAASRFFLVGDFKQSIYRFRGAVPHVFRDCRAATPERGRLTLSRNFRSTPAVLDFVNQLFLPVFGEDYVPLQPSREQVTERPGVEFLWTPPTGDRPDAAASRRVEAARIADRIRELIENREPVVADRETGQPRGAAAGDFAILFRSLSNVPLYEEALRSAGLDYYLVGGHAFYAQQEVHDVLNLLRATLSECDEIALAGVLRSPLFGLPDEALFWLARRGTLSAGLFSSAPPAELSDEDKRMVVHAREVLTRLRSEKDRLPAAELLRRVWEDTTYDAALVADFLGERKLANLDKLHEQAREADASGSGLRGLAARLTEFVNQPPKEALAATTAEDAGVVRLMTVHGSKGLEFPIVVLADLNSRPRANTTSATFDPALGPLVKPPAVDPTQAKKTPPVGLDFWKATERPEEEAERDRLFYVACTRAADRLILSASVDPGGKLEGPWLARLTEGFDLATGDSRQGGAKLVAVTEPRKQETSTRPTERSTKRLGDAIESARRRLASGPTLGLAAPIGLEPQDLRTFSVSRLSGKVLPSVDSPSDWSHAPRDGIDPRRLGTLVHAIAERLDPATENPDSEIDAWADALAPQHLRRSIAGGAAEAARLVKQLVRSPHWHAMRDAPRLERETEFLLHWPPKQATGAPARLRGYLDALYQDPGGRWHLIDYKTNSISAADVPKAAAEYALQMAVYAHAVEAAVGEPPSSVTLLFLTPGIPHAVAWDDATRAASLGMINAAIEHARARGTGE